MIQLTSFFRATKKIKAGEEITATYLDLEDGLNRVYRQVLNSEYFKQSILSQSCFRTSSIIISCSIADVTVARQLERGFFSIIPYLNISKTLLNSFEKDEEKRKEMMSLHHLLNNCDTPQKIVKNINQQLKLARCECHGYISLSVEKYMMFFSLITGIKKQYCLKLLTIGYETMAEIKDEEETNREKA